MIIVHSENSTTRPEWHPNPVQRGTWAIYQTCVVTIFLCVWTTIHLNIPRPYEKSSTQIWRKIGWSLLAIIAPEFVALSAWWQYRDVKALLRAINKTRPQKESYYRHCLNSVAFACFAPLRILDWLRTSRLGHLLVKLSLVRDRTMETCKDEQSFAAKSDLRREARVQATMEDANLTWTMDMAFYVMSGGCVYRSRTRKVSVLQLDTIVHLSTYEPLSLVRVQQAVLQNPGKANTISKAITCVQALWFCMQCITRISQDLAISLLELNTFSHCVGALLIYLFWWHKPYDVESHVFVESPSLDLQTLAIHKDLARCKPWAVLQPPVVRVLRLSGVISRQPPFQPPLNTYLIVDEKDNCLLWMGKRERTLPPSAISSCRTTRPKLQIPGTGLYVVSDNSDETVDGFDSGCDFRPWQDFWRLWLDLGCPIPGGPPNLRANWFSDRSVTNLSLRNERNRILGRTPKTVSLTVGIVMISTFAVYGGLHLLAWQYSFNSKAERFLWQTSTVITMSTGSIVVMLFLPRILFGSRVLKRRITVYFRLGLEQLTYLFILLVIAARAFLVIESFIALPNSPPSTYVIPTWSAYIPHI